MSKMLAQLDDVDRGMAGLEEGQARSVQGFCSCDNGDDTDACWVFRMKELLQDLS